VPHGWYIDAEGNLVSGRHTAASPPVPAPVTRRFLGLDLGKAIDHTAFVMLQWTWPQPPPPPAGPGPTPRRPRGPVYDDPALRRWPLGTPYTAIADWLVSLYQSPAAAPQQGLPRVLAPVLVVDETGVGTAVVEMILGALRRARAPGGFVAVTITGGSAVTQAGEGRWRVAKKELASVLVSLFGGHRLRIADLDAGVAVGAAEVDFPGSRGGPGRGRPDAHRRLLGERDLKPALANRARRSYPRHVPRRFKARPAMRA
jgi:hypothetical protein